MVRKLVNRLFLIWCFVLVMLSLFLIQAVNVSAGIVYEGNLFNGDNFTLGNDTFILGGQGDNKYWMNYTLLVLKKINNVTNTSELYTIKYAKCAYTMYYDYCYDYGYHDFTVKRTYEGSRLEPSMHIRIVYDAPVVIIERTTPLVLNKGQKTLIPITLKNTGTNLVDVSYTEELPSETIISDCVGCNIVDNKLTKKIRLAEGESSSFEYRLISSDYYPKEWNATYSYTLDSGFNERSMIVSATVNKPYSFDNSISKTSANKLDDNAVYYLQINNDDFYELMYINTKVYTRNAIIAKYTDLEYVGNGYYIYEGVIQPRKSKNFTLNISSENLGVYTITTNASVLVGGEKFYHNTEYLFNVNLSGIVPIMTINNTKLVPGDNLSVVLTIENVEAKDTYYNVFSTLKGLSEEYFNYPSIRSGDKILLYNNTYIVPPLINNSIVSFEFSGLYRTLNNQELKFYTHKELLVESIYVADMISSDIVTDNSTGNISNVLYTNVSNNSIALINTNNVNTVNNDVLPLVNNSNSASSNSDESSTDIPDEFLDSEDESEKKDLLTRIFDGINRFLESIFGKK